MNTPKPMATPNLADLLAKRPLVPPATRGEARTAAVPVAAPDPRKTGNDEEASAAPVDAEPIAADAPERAPDLALGEEREYLRSIALYLPRSLHQQLGNVAAERGTTRTALILGAINSTHARLGAALAPSPAHSRGQDLFSVPQSRPDSEPSVQTTIRVTDAQHAAISALVTEHRTNRSRLIATVLTLYLADS